MKRTPRPYQIAALDATRSQLQQYGSTVVVLPTGLGKTVYAAKLITDWDQGNSLFLAHTRELIQQSADKLGAELGYKPIIEMNIEGADPNNLWQGGLVVVGSVQSMIADRRLEKYRQHGFGLIVVDECHHATSASYRKVIDFFREGNPNCKIVGITATPNRSDGTALGLMFESVAYQMTIEHAIDQGWLVPIRQEVVTVTGLDFTGVSVRKNKQGEQDFSEEQLQSILTEEENLHGMALATLDKVGTRPTLIFTAGVRHAQLMADVLNRYRPGCAKSVDGNTDKEERKETLRNFLEGRIQFLANCQVLTEGFDAPACASIVMGRPTKSLSLYVQMLGRGLRPLPNLVDGVPESFERKMAILTSDKPHCLVLDFVGVSNHKLIDAHDVLGGCYDVETRELARKEGSFTQDVAEQLELANLLVAMKRDWKHRQDVKARDFKYDSYEEDPFGGTGNSVGKIDPFKRGGATDGQVAFLVNLGVPFEKAMSFSKGQAGAVIDKLSSERCTAKQANVLRKHRIDPEGINVKRAGRIIDAIANNGWRRPEVLPE